jgi:glycosyltransferase involved in cell wall biosynthesis
MRCPNIDELPPSPNNKTGWPWTEQTPQMPVEMPDRSFWPRISIITPSYNQAAFIEETIRAVLLQGYPNLEYIISEDCSTDQSLEIIDKFRKWLVLIKSDRNRGMSHAINKGFEKCTGEIITWISTDDVYLPGAFAAVSEHWSVIKDYGAVVGAFHFMDAKSKISPHKYVPYLPHPAPIDLTTSIENWRLHQVATFYLRDALDNVGRYVREDLKHNMDRELIYRIAMEHKLFLLDTSLAAFRIHRRSKSWDYNNMINMAYEYASIQDMFMTGDPQEDAIRQKYARLRIGKGYIKFAKYNPDVFASINALLQVPFYYPGLIKKRGYWKAWLQTMRLNKILMNIYKIFFHYSKRNNQNRMQL